MKKNPPAVEASLKPVLTLQTHNRSLQITREGAGFIFVIFIVGIGAIFTSNNLLYLVLAMCCSFLVISGILSELTLKKITVNSSLPATVYAKDVFPLILTVTNPKNYFSSYSLRIAIISDNKHGLEGNPGVYIFHLPPKSTEQKTMLVKAAKRGLLRIAGFQVSTSFPFGFFYKKKFLPEIMETVVFPVIQPVHLPPPSHPSAEGQGIVRHQGEEIFALKEYREGDPLNAVHWKSSAKTGNLRVKELLTEGEQSFTLFLNLKDSQTNRQVPEAILEERVSEAASLSYNLIRRGDEVSLKTEGHHQIPFGKSEVHLENIMTFLAFVGLKEPERKKFSGENKDA
ncbi:MAG: hypothetical protein NPINA01_32940 [Nitrospinaceae bacterium]|nr:MAG: hypothetical protein NPINA01_32940 [Nitrospinaceae bacterium]